MPDNEKVDLNKMKAAIDQRVSGSGEGVSQEEGSAWGNERKLKAMAHVWQMRQSGADDREVGMEIAKFSEGDESFGEELRDFAHTLKTRSIDSLRAENFNPEKSPTTRTFLAMVKEKSGGELDKLLSSRIYSGGRAVNPSTASTIGTDSKEE